MSRRASIIFAVFLLTFPVAQPATADHGVRTGTLQFDVELDGRSIGEHRFAFHQLPNDLIEVDIGIDLEVKFGPFTMFDYRHRNKTEWRAGRLVRMQSDTNDDGSPFSVNAVAGPKGLSVESNSTAAYTTPPETLATTYWIASTVKQTRLINSQNGELLEIKVSELDRESVRGPNGPIAATRYRLDGDLKIDLWYDDTDTLVKLAFEARGGEVTYRLVARSGVTSVTSMLAAVGARR
jgi:hypothetical protein